MKTFKHVEKELEALNKQLTELSNEMVLIQAIEIINFIKKRNVTFVYEGYGSLSFEIESREDDNKLNKLLGGGYHCSKDLDPETHLYMSYDDGNYTVGFDGTKLKNIVEKYNFHIDFSKYKEIIKRQIKRYEDDLKKHDAMVSEVENITTVNFVGGKLI